MSDEKIQVKSSKRGQEIEVNAPEILKKKDLQSVIESLGEDMVYRKVMAQLLIDFRAMVRGKMESQTDDQWNYELDQIAAEDFSDWQPTAQQRKSKEEKAAETLSKLSPDELKAAMAKLGIDPSALAGKKKDRG